ncbi:Universal stress protein family [Vibrio sp. B1FLJ16]|uniref:universal stress protein n=1 Tax=Vibrio sp. B1FLJ16 TaxID=2751178 RepID=UPI0015F5513C|nr:universal stress protein [Vibrio sp. B1FLJ16]CAD7820027.1 Universal stress protein family [Vibrio sp. B1FLJ16]CAE6941497.1 Universal stress protein family [Vibrio sp. B1FLJ16]
MSFHHLLFPVAPDQLLGDDFNEVLQIADAQSAKITLVTVIEKLEELKEIAKYSNKVLNLLDEATTTAEQVLEKQAQILKANYPNIEFSMIVRLGIPFIEIIKVAEEVQADIIVIHALRQHKAQACQRGSTTLYLMRQSAYPIWSISTRQSPVRRIAVAVDVSFLEQDAFNEKILSLAFEIGALTRSELILLHAWNMDLTGFFQKWGSFRDLDVDLISQEIQSERTERMKSLTTPHDHLSVKHQIKLLKGDAKTVIPQFVIDNSIDMVIMGSLARTGVAGFFMGHTAESMIDKFACSVLTLKPDEFHSPVLDKK